MNNPDHKSQILGVLRSADEPLSSKEIEQAIHGDISSRSLRRWISELVLEKVIVRIGSSRATRYQLAKGLDVQANHQLTERAEQSIAYVRQPLIKRKPTTYNTEWFESYRVGTQPYFPQEQLEELKQAGLREGAEAPAGTYARHIYHRLLIDLSYHSSRLEGNTYSLIDTERLILQGEDVEGKLDEEKIMILNHKEAIRHLVDRAPIIQINIDEIYTLHYLLSDGLIPNKYAGKVRDHGVRISQSTYIPFENPKILESQLKLICTVASKIVEPFEQSLFLLIHIAYLQAFTDVNKRTSRIAANIPLIKNNCVPLSFNDIDMADYTAAMIAIYELCDVRPLIELYIFSYLRTCEVYSATVEAMGFDEVRVLYRQQRREMIRYIVSHQLHGEALQIFIDDETRRHIPRQSHKDFIEDIWDDLKELTPARIASIGISTQQLNEWLKKQKFD